MASNHPPTTIEGRLLEDSRFKAIDGRTMSNGTGGNKLSVSHLVRWHEKRAREAGTERADQELDAFLDADNITITQALWVYGVCAHTSLKLAPEIYFVPVDQMPPSVEKNNYLNAKWRFDAHDLPAPQAAIIKNISVPKIVPNITLNGPEPGWEQATSAARKSASLLAHIALLLNCLRGVCCLPGYATSYFPPETPSAGSSGSAALFDLMPRKMTSLDKIAAVEIQPLIENFSDLSTDSKARFIAALYRLAQAKGRFDPGDISLDLGIALEMLLLNEEHNRQELPGQLSLHFRLRGAWLLGESAEERLELYRKLREIYTFRSKIAHNGFSSELNKLPFDKRDAKLNSHIEICERIIRRLILRGAPKSWDALILGEH